MPEPTTFEEHAAAFRDATEAMETNAHEQYRLRDEIHYADKMIADMEFDTSVEVITEWSASERKPNNAEERKAEVSKRLKAHGPYLDAARDRAEKQKDLMIVTAAQARHENIAKLHRMEMQHRTALLAAGAERG